MISPLDRIGLSRDRVEAMLRPHAPMLRQTPKAFLDSKIEKEVRRLKSKGESDLQIARALHITRAVVVSILQPVKKGRGGPRGEVFRERLTEAQVKEIRKRCDGGEKLESIAADFGVTKACVSMIGSRQRRKQTPE